MKEILETHSVAALKKMISRHNIKGYSKMKKADIIKLMTSPEHYGKFAGTKPAEKTVRKKAEKKATHTMPNGDIHTGKKHTKDSKLVKKAEKKADRPHIKMTHVAPEKKSAPKPPSIKITEAKDEGKKYAHKNVKTTPLEKSGKKLKMPKGGPSREPSRQSSSEEGVDVEEVKVDGKSYYYDSSNNQYYSVDTHDEVPNPRKKKKTKKAAK